jgi:hypothetical protein
MADVGTRGEHYYNNKVLVARQRSSVADHFLRLATPYHAHSYYYYNNNNDGTALHHGYNHHALVGGPVDRGQHWQQGDRLAYHSDHHRLDAATLRRR